MYAISLQYVLLFKSVCVFDFAVFALLLSIFSQRSIFVCKIKYINSNTDLRYAIEQFTKAYLRHPAPYMQLDEADHEEHIDENYDNDEEWVTPDPDEDVNDSDVEMDHILDDEFEAVDELDADARMECEENEEAWIVKPMNYPTPLFDTAYPALTESEEFFKLSDQDVLLLVTEVMHNRFHCDYHFDEQCVKIFKDAMIRYILAECRKD